MIYHSNKQRRRNMNLIDRAKNIIISPKTERDVVANEEPNIQQIFTGYVLPLALVPTIAMIIGWGLIGMLGFKSFNYGIAMGLVTLLNALVGVFVAAFVIDALAPSFGSQKEFGKGSTTYCLCNDTGMDWWNIKYFART